MSAIDKAHITLCLGITVSGSTWFLRGQPRYFIEQGYGVRLLAPGDPQATEFCREEGCLHEPVSIERRISPMRDLVTLFRLWRIFGRVQPDIVNLGTPKMGLLGVIAARLARVPVCIYTCHGLRYEPEAGLKRALLKATERTAGLFAHRVICVSPSLREKAVGDGVFREIKTTVIGPGSCNGLDRNRFSKNSVSENRRREWAEEIGLEGKFVFGFIGRLTDRKGVNELVEAFARVYSLNSDARLLMVGPEDRTQLADEAILERMEEHPGIVRTGLFPDAPLALSVMDVFVMPTWGEGFGNVFLEAAAMGVPIVGTDGTGARDAFRDGLNGIAVPVMDEDALFAAMRRYMLDRELRARHGDEGVRWAQRFQPDVIWAGLESFYRRCLEDKART